jgi:Mg2+-importing ATPase
MVVAYIGLIEVGKRLFYGRSSTAPRGRSRDPAVRHLRRRAAYFSGHAAR